MILFLSALHTVILYLLIRWIIGRVADRDLRIHGWVSLSLKILAGWGLGILYLTLYQGGDTYQFHDFASNMADIGRMDPVLYLKMLFGESPPPNADALLRAPRLFFMVKLTSVLHLATSNNYWITSAYMSFFCWYGLYAFSVRLSGLYPKRRWIFLFAALYLPSMVFWASGLTKESIAIGAFGLFMTAIVPSGKVTATRVLTALLMSLILWEIKYYYLVPLLVSVVLFYVLNNLAPLKWKWPAIAVVIVLLFVVTWFGASAIHPNLDTSLFPRVVYENYEVFLEKSDPGDALILPGHCASWPCLLRSFPNALWSTLFRPYVWESSQWVKILAGIENGLLFLMFLYFLYDLRQFRSWGRTEWAFVISAILFIILTGGFLGLSAPNFGTLARYRVIILPVYVILCCRNLPVQVVKSRLSSKRTRPS